MQYRFYVLNTTGTSHISPRKEQKKLKFSRGQFGDVIELPEFKDPLR